MANDPASAPPAQYPMPSTAWPGMPPGYPYPWPPPVAAPPQHTETERLILETLKTLTLKVDDLSTDRVKRTDLDALRREVFEQAQRAEARGYSRSEVDAQVAAAKVERDNLRAALIELKTTVGTQAERQLARWGGYIAIAVGAYTLAHALGLIH